MEIAIIVAVDTGGGIGREQGLPWKLSSDLRRFKTLTLGQCILMGRRTYDSLPSGALPGRRNVVISRTVSTLPDAEVYPSIESALSVLEGQIDKLYVIGGGEIYRQLLPQATELYITEVDTNLPLTVDTVFPPYDKTQWEMVAKEHVPKDEINEYPSTYYHLRRRIQ